MGARTPGGRLSIVGSAHRGDKRRVVNEILIEVNILIEDRRIDGWGRDNLPRCGGGRLFNRSERSRAVDRNRARGQINESEIGLTKAVAIV